MYKHVQIYTVIYMHVIVFFTHICLSKGDVKITYTIMLVLFTGNSDVPKWMKNSRMGRKTPNKQSIKKHNVFQCAGTLIYTYTFSNKTGLSLKIFLKGKEMINILTLKVRLSFRGQAKTVKRVDLSRYVDCNHGFPEK